MIAEISDSAERVTAVMTSHLESGSVKERPILMNAPMVRATLADTKTQTRRVVKGIALEWLGKDGFTPDFVAHPENHLCPYGVPGDRLWVRETWAPLTKGYAYRADQLWNASPAGRWHPSIHMPRVANRITLEVTGVRVERLREISDADCIAEGAPGGHGSIPGYLYNATPLEHYRFIWETINGAGSWDVNPWVWVVEFRRIEAADIDNLCRQLKRAKKRAGEELE